MRRAPDGDPEPAVGGERATLGFLFVHGIGQQRRGQTLAQGEEAICVWLSRWLGSGIVLDRERAWRTVPAPDDPAAPAFAHLYLTASDSKAGVAHWLFAESWWADSFEVM